MTRFCPKHDRIFVDDCPVCEAEELATSSRSTSLDDEDRQPHPFHADPGMPDTCGICWQGETNPVHIGKPIP